MRVRNNNIPLIINRSILFLKRVDNAALGSHGLGREPLHILFQVRQAQNHGPVESRIQDTDRESEEKWIQKRLKFQGIPSQTNPVLEYLIWLWISEVIL